MTLLQKKLKQNLLLAVLAIFMVMQLFTFSFACINPIRQVYAWDGVSYATPQGLGTQNLPYLITSAEHLKWVSIENNAGNFPSNTYFKLANHINLEDYEWVPIGTEANPFSGKFNADNYSIYNLNMKDINAIYKYNGLFGYASSATIENLRLTEVDFLLNLTEAIEPIYVGAVVGYATGNTVVSRIINGGTIQIQNATSMVYAGGIAGYMQNSTLTQLVNNIVLSTLLVEDAYVGGLAGKVLNSTVSSSYNKQTVNITTINSLFVGGLIGESSETNIQKVYNDGMITGKSTQVFVGGITGLASNATANTFNQKFMYNTKKITLYALVEDEPNLYIGGLFGKVEANNTVGYAYNIAEVALDINSVGTTTNRGSLIGGLNADATLQYSYYNRAYEVGAEDGVGEVLGIISQVYDLSTVQMRTQANYEGSDWKFSTAGAVWLITGSINGGYPVIRYVGNYSVHSQVFGGGKVSPSGSSFYNIGIGQVYNLTANAGYQIQKVILNNVEYNNYRGKTSLAFNVPNDAMPVSQEINLVVIYESIPFVKTQMFYYLIVVGSLIVFMIVGTAVINYRYAIKMDKIMGDKKKALHLDPEHILEKENTKKPKKTK
jgi:hypothetical protein